VRSAKAQLLHAFRRARCPPKGADSISLGQALPPAAAQATAGLRPHDAAVKVEPAPAARALEKVRQLRAVKAEAAGGGGERDVIVIREKPQRRAGAAQGGGI